jgi:rhodanese-related sulfurtransferase
MTTTIIDTREPYEFEASHVDGAINIPPQQFMSDTLPAALDGIQPDSEIILYCRSGMRSNTVGHLLRQHGFTNIVNGVNEHHVAKLIRER